MNRLAGSSRGRGQFPPLDIKFGEIGQARKSDAEIIKVNLKPGFMKIVDDGGVGCCFGRVTETRVFQYFNDDLCVVDASSINPPNKVPDEVWMVQQFGGRVERNTNVTESSEIEVFSELGQRSLTTNPMSPKVPVL